MDLIKFSFHEADVLELRQDGDQIALKLGGVDCATGPCCVTVHFRDVARLSVDSAPTDKVEMYCEDGEVLDLSRRSDGTFEILIEWNSFATHCHVTKYYEVACGSVQVTRQET